MLTIVRRFAVKTFEDLFDGSGDVLRYVAHEHHSLRCPTADSNRSRWPFHPLWIDLVGQIDRLSAQGISREIDDQAVLAVRQQRVAIAVYGYLKHFAALMSAEGDEAASLGLSRASLMRLIDRLHDPLSWSIDVAAKRDKIRLGL